MDWKDILKQSYNSFIQDAGKNETLRRYRYSINNSVDWKRLLNTVF